MKYLRKPYEEWEWDFSYPLRNPLWRKEKDNALLKWSHHLLKINKPTKNKMKALSLPNKIKVKIASTMKVSCHMMTKIKFKIKDYLKMLSKFLWMLPLPKMFLSSHLERPRRKREHAEHSRLHPG